MNKAARQLFREKLHAVEPRLQQSDGVDTLQVNVGYRCNMSCLHCHFRRVRRPLLDMDLETVNAVLLVLKANRIERLDITGGAPELNPHVRRMIKEARDFSCHVAVRTNLTIFEEEGTADFPDFYAQHEVELLASLPCYTRENVDGLRGAGTFDKSVRSLRRLNQLGYGTSKHLLLNLVYNPGGAFLAPPQHVLESEYKTRLADAHAIHFDHLYALSNIPLGGFRNMLVEQNALTRYIDEAAAAFNPRAAHAIMCRHLVSVGPDGTLYDCDFNQAAGRQLIDGYPKNIRNFDLGALAHRSIAFQEYCVVCTAGSGST